MPNEVEIRITADDMTGPGFMSVMAKLAALKAAAKEIGGAFSPNIDSGMLTSSLMLVKQKMQSLGIADIADINQTPGRITSQLMLLKRLIQQAKISDLLDINLSESSLAAQMAALKGISQTGLIIPVEYDVNKASAAAALSPLTFLGQGQVPWISAAMAGAAMRATGGGSGNSGVTTLTAAMAAAAVQAGATAAAVNRLTGASGGGGGGGGGLWSLAFAAGAAGKAWGFLMQKFGGATTGWTGKFAGIGLWHIALDGFIEGAIIAVASMAALGAAADALGGTAINLYQHLQAVYQVNSALGSKIPPLTDRFVALQKALAPQGIEIFGGALNAINMESGSMAHAMGPVVNLFTTFMAKFDLWLKGFGSTGGIFRAGIGFLSQIGGFLSSIGEGIGNLIKDDPGIARFLLDIFQGFGKVFDILTKLPGPLVELALGLHGAYVWGSVLAGLGVRLIASFQGMFKWLVALAANPYADLAILAATFAYLAYEANQADQATKAFISQQNYQLSGLSGWQAFAQSISDVATDMRKIQSTNLTSVMNSMGTWQQTLTLGGYALSQLGTGIQKFFGGLIPGHGKELIQSFRDIGSSISDIFGSNQAFGAKAQADINAYYAQIVKLEGGQVGMIGSVGTLMQKGYSLSQSWALLSLAGVKLGDSLAVANQKVLNLLEGYQNLSIRGGILANSVNALTFQSLQQQSQVSALTGAWSNFFTTISGGQSGLTSFEQALRAMGVKGFGLPSGKDLTGQQNFMAAAQAAQTEANNLTLMASAAGLGAQGTTLLNNAVRDMVQMLLPAAKNSQTLTGILYTLALQGGYTGADSFKALAAAMGHSHDPATQLANIVRILTGASANLTKDIKALSDALGTTLNNAMSTAIFAARGGQAAFDAFANTAVHSKNNMHDMIGPADALITQLIGVTGSASAAKGEFDVFGKALGIPISMLNKLWAQAIKTQGAIDALHGTTVSINYQSVYTAVGTPPPAIPYGSLTKKRAGGGGTSGWTMMGEQGRELAWMPGGSYVSNAAQTAAIMAAGGRRGGAPCFKIDASGASDLERALVNWFLKYVRVNGGGNVQSAWDDDLLG